MSKIFANLILPVTIEEFFSNYWEKAILHVSENSEEFFNYILTVEMLDDFLKKGDISPLAIRLVKDGNDIPSKNWVNQQKLINSKISEVAANDKIFYYLDEGATLIINAAEKSISSLHQLCRDLEQEFKCQIQANIYITPPQSQGFSIHYDIHDVLILQISGSKIWQIYDSPIKLQTKLALLTNTPNLLQNIELNSGDVLYLPRGTVHSAATNNEISIHLTISINSRYGFNLIQNLAELAEEDVFFRQAIPHNEINKADYIQSFKRKFAEIFEKYEVEYLIEKQHRKFVETQKIEYQNRFIEFLKLEKLKLNSIVRKQEGLDFVINEKETEIELVFGTEKIYFPKFLRDSIQICFQPESFAVCELEGLITDKSKVEIIKELVQKGFLRVEKI